MGVMNQGNQKRFLVNFTHVEKGRSTKFVLPSLIVNYGIKKGIKVHLGNYDDEMTTYEEDSS